MSNAVDPKQQQSVEPNGVEPTSAENGHADAAAEAPVAPTVVNGHAPASTNPDATQPAQDEAPQQPNGTPAENEKKSEEQCNRHLKRYRLWNTEEYQWDEFDPSSIPPPVKKKVDDFNYFYLDIRYKEGHFSNPERYMRHWSEILLGFLRATIGGFYDNPDRAPEWFFKYLWDIKKKQAQLRHILHEDGHKNVSDEDRKSDLRGLGLRVSKLGDNADEEIASFKENLELQLGYLVDFLDEEFKPIADKLALQVSHGQVAFNMLWYYFEKEKQYTMMNDEGYLIAFIMEKFSIVQIDGVTFFKIKGYQYKWNGIRYVRTEVRNNIKSYEGTISISSLPVQYLSEANKETLRERGKIYTSLSGMHYRSYQGYRVVVDATAHALEGGYSRDPNQIIPDLRDDRLHLLPPTMGGFVLQEKIWTKFDVTKIGPVTFNEDAFEHLVMEASTKKLIKGLVDATCNINTEKKIFSDVISGKGGGLIAVLHGPPGTGKTLTAESVADDLKRPLYMVSSSELSLSASGLERSLKSILKLATAWDAVLLIDEADVLLEQRSLNEIQRNSLVSVALKEFEYHKGVLFLTTNRITAFDEAFLSRFSLAIRYPDLDKESRISIWKNFFRLAGCDVEEPGTAAASDKPVVSANELDDFADKPFNGRVIKNIVRTASALALSLKETFSSEHVKVVVQAQEKFLAEFATITKDKRSDIEH